MASGECFPLSVCMCISTDNQMLDEDQIDLKLDSCLCVAKFPQDDEAKLKVC